MNINFVIFSNNELWKLYISETLEFCKLEYFIFLHNFAKFEKFVSLERSKNLKILSQTYLNKL